MFYPKDNTWCLFLRTVCQYHLRPLGGQLYPPTGRDLTENGPKILDNFPDLHSPTYFLAFSFLCNIFSHFPAKYFLIFFSLMENVPRSSNTFCNIPYHLHKSPNLLFQNIFLQQKLWNLEDFVSKSTWNAKYVNVDCLKPGICLLHLQANVMHSGRSGIYLNEYRGMTSSKSMVDIRS